MFDFNAHFDVIDNSADGSNVVEFRRLILEGAQKLGRDFTHAPKYKDYFAPAWFVGIVEEEFQWLFNTWPK